MLSDVKKTADKQQFHLATTKQPNRKIVVSHSKTTTKVTADGLNSSNTDADYISRFVDSNEILSRVTLGTPNQPKYMETLIETNNPSLAIKVFEEVLNKKDANPPLVPQIEPDILKAIEQNQELKSKFEPLKIKAEALKNQAIKPSMGQRSR